MQVSERRRVARFESPAIATKTFKAADAAKKHKIVVASFQSTSTCNVAVVNCLKKCSFCIRRKEHGTKNNKFAWAIEMSNARCFYLRLCNPIDAIDCRIKNAHQYHRAWKYRHKGELHGKVLACCATWGMRAECAEGTINPEWPMPEKERLG